MTELNKPHALLLDFGGVVAATTKKPNWVAEIAEIVYSLLTNADDPRADVPKDVIALDIRAGATAAGHWKDAMSRPYAPREMTYAEYWGDFVGADWPDAARAVILPEAEELCRKLGHLRQDRELRGGMVELLKLARADGVKIGIVSNSLSGQVHREYLAQEGISDLFDIEIYSDEVAMRKPNPRIIELAADELGVAVGESWYVGDNFDRDAICGARAGVGMNILLEARDTYKLPFEVRLQPDRILADGHALLALYREASQHEAVGV